MNPTIEEMKAELLRAGWKLWRKNLTIWVAPWGAIYRGPAGAFRVMKVETEIRGVRGKRV